MTPQQIIKFRKNLINWFQANQRKLPWRETNNPYKIWIAEVMLQQTQVIKVIPYFNKFIKQIPNIKSLANVDLQRILKLLEGLGYYARARNMHRAARLILQNHKGEVPTNYEDIKKLPGFGDYIAAAVLSQAFNFPYQVVDGNVKRVLARVFLIDLPINVSNGNKIFKNKAADLLDQSHPGDFNQAMMELGALVCKPQNPLCLNCPVSKYCKALSENKQIQYPKKIKKKPAPEYKIVVGVVQKSGHILIVQRKSSGLLGGLWEFPGGKIKNDESAINGCIREMREKVNAEVTQPEFLAEIKHAYTHFKIKMNIFKCLYSSGKIILNEHQDFRWIKIKEISEFPVHGANLKILPYLKN
ncbi:A/G-specific adenine glycosylase [candidate division KSB1 bacterium]|nr:A/G-specific adenine glycosylase [candidate division KSB1 bacterium]